MYVRSLAFLLVFSLLPVCAFALNMLFLEDAPAAKFDDLDWKLLTQTVDEALENTPKGEVLHWENPETGHLGSVTMMGSKKSAGQPCKVLKVYSEAATIKGESIIMFCKQQDGEWKIVTRSPSRKK